MNKLAEQQETNLSPEMQKCQQIIDALGIELFVAKDPMIKNAKFIVARSPDKKHSKSMHVLNDGQLEMATSYVVECVANLILKQQQSNNN